MTMIIKIILIFISNFDGDENDDDIMAKVYKDQKEHMPENCAMVQQICGTIPDRTESKSSDVHAMTNCGCVQ